MKKTQCLKQNFNKLNSKTKQCHNLMQLNRWIKTLMILKKSFSKVQTKRKSLKLKIQMNQMKRITILITQITFRSNHK